MNRRKLLSGLIAVTAPAIVPIGSLMPVKAVKEFDAYEFARILNGRPAIIAVCVGKWFSYSAASLGVTQEEALAMTILEWS